MWVRGDAVLIRTPAWPALPVLIPGCGRPSGTAADRFILPHLKAEGIRRLDGIFLSHPHSDHIGGLLSIMREIIRVDVILRTAGFEHHHTSAFFAGYRRGGGGARHPGRNAGNGGPHLAG